MIPKTFEVAGVKWSVHFMDQNAAEKHYGGHHKDLDGIGLCSPRSAAQYIIQRDGYAAHYYEITHFHEVLHAWFYAMGFELGEGIHTEQNIDAIAHLWHQYEVSKKGETDVS